MFSVQDSTLGVGYRLPPKEIRDIVDAPPLPALSFSPHRDKILFLKRRALPPLAELARPEEKLAGVRIDGKCNTRTRMSFYTGIGIHQLLPDGTLGSEVEVHGFPEGAKINFVTWSPDGRHLAFTIRFDDENTDSKLKVWVAQVETGIARPLFQSHEYCLNAVFDNFVWVNDSCLLVCTIPLSRGDPPKKPLVPFGPKIQSNEQKNIIQVRTFQDLLKDEYDEDLFDYYATSQLVLASLDGMVKEIGPPAVYTSMDPSPDHKYLLISSIHRPYSFIVPCGRFPKKVEMWTADGKFVRQLCDLPLAEDIPIAFNSVRRGMRSLNWRADKPSTLYWYVYVSLISNYLDILDDIFLRYYVIKDMTIDSIRIYYKGVQFMISCTNSWFPIILTHALENYLFSIRALDFFLFVLTILCHPKIICNTKQFTEATFNHHI